MWDIAIKLEYLLCTDNKKVMNMTISARLSFLDTASNILTEVSFRFFELNKSWIL
jgi:hypothetical protein